MSQELPPEEPLGEKPLTIKFRNTEIQIVDQPLCTNEQLHEAERIVDKNYESLVNLLPADHYFRDPKTLHSITIQQEELDILDNLGFDPSEPNTRLFLFVSGTHDLGRVIDGLKKEKMAAPPEFQDLKHHGQYSVKILENWGALQCFPKQTQEIIKYAVEHHAEATTVGLPGNPTEQQKIEHVFNCLLRDFDKLSNYIGKTDKWLSAPETKAQQFIIMRSIVGKDSEGNELFQDEANTVTPEGMELFLSGHLIPWEQCFTYETYMLNQFSLFYDMNLNPVIKKVAESGALNKYLDYFEKQLPAEQFQAIDQKAREYLNDLGIELPEAQKA